MHGWHRSYVTKLERAGRIVLSPDGGMVDWAATDALIGETSDPSKLGVADRWAAQRPEATPAVQVASPAISASPLPPPAPASDAGSAGARSGYLYWREQREKELALAAQRDREQAEGKLVDAETVRRARFELARQVRDRLLTLPERVHKQVAAESDPLTVLLMLDEEVRDCLRQLVTEIAGTGGEDGSG
ncbi:terminase small subunit [Pandoraea sp. ISTKB]|uniref:terminase small subunit n=1 Tax=Pandoraea sp. ISTKB TaxID=1586708 RepID=UPI00086D3840|nr:terminase small subunit [Pandoraea sp. ISTKB]ODP33084.1 hypothetical protein A9762_20795 [Pandoraea sp. ISTKB]